MRLPEYDHSRRRELFEALYFGSVLIITAIVVLIRILQVM